jgi:copper oxidase (laccase) domain-containing protein
MDMAGQPAPAITRVAAWEKIPWLRHGFSTRQGGFSTVYAGEGAPELNLGFTAEDDPGRVRANRELFSNAVAPGFGAMIFVRQVHGTAVKTIARGEQGLMDDAGRGVPRGMARDGGGYGGAGNCLDDARVWMSSR